MISCCPEVESAVLLMARTKQTAALIDEEPAMSGEEATFSQEGAMSIDGDGSEELLDSLPQGEIGARDPEDVSGRREPEVPEAVAGGGSGDRKAPEGVSVEKPSADDVEASVPVKGKNFEASRDYEIYIESAYAGDFGKKRFKAGVDAGSSAAEEEGTSGYGHSSKVSDARIRTPAVIDKTYRLNRSRVGEAELAMYVERGYFEAGRARCPGDEEIPQPKANEAVVFRDYFEAGLRLPALFILQRLLLSTGRNRGPCATHGTGRRDHSTPRGHGEAGSTRRGLRLQASAGPAVELLGSAELWVVQELAGTGTAVQVQQELAGGELVVQGVLAAAVLRVQRVLAPAALGVQQVLAAAELGVQLVLAPAEVADQSPLAGRRR
ncbi:hypothetical protein EJB05_24118, partial [Eragrostis curvula]